MAELGQRLDELMLRAKQKQISDEKLHRDVLKCGH